MFKVSRQGLETTVRLLYMDEEDFADPSDFKQKDLGTNSEQAFSTARK